MHLLDIKKGEKVKVDKLECQNGLKHRLCSMGIHQGELIEVIKNDHGPLIVKVFDSKIAIGRGQAKQIAVLR